MAWWVWVGVSLAWALFAWVGALWLGASAKVVEEHEHPVPHTWDNELVEWEWRDVA